MKTNQGHTGASVAQERCEGFNEEKDREGSKKL